MFPAHSAIEAQQPRPPVTDVEASHQLSILMPTVTDESSKRKRGGSDEGLNIHRSGPVQATMDASSSSANSPLPSPTSSSSGQPGGVNGHGGRRGVEKAMRRNIDRVYFGAYDIKTWYYSPYPFDEDEWASMADAGNSLHLQQPPRRIRQEPGTLSNHTRESSISGLGGALSTSADKAPALAALEVEAPLATRRDWQTAPAKALWVCDGCFKYMRTYGGYTVHKKDCKETHPPGKKVYQRGAHIIWEVDGWQEKLYAQNLSLFGKLFIDHKTIYFDVEPFTFYVLTDATSQFDHVLGFFSKEKISYDDYNLACIITFPPFQKKGFGTLMIEYSYYLSSLSATLGTPERPLSNLGFKGYLSYWSAVILRTLALFFHDRDPSISNCLLPASHTLVSPAKHKQSVQTVASNAALAEERQKREVMLVRKTLLGLAAPKSEAAEGLSSEEARSAAIKRAPRGWAGEITRMQKSPSASVDHREVKEETVQEGEPSGGEDAPAAAATVTPPALNPAPSHPLLQLEEEGEVVDVETTLDRLSSATNIRVDDICFALAEMGLLKLAKKEGDGQGPEGGITDKIIVITRGMVRQAIKYNRVKRPVLDVKYVLT